MKYPLSALARLAVVGLAALTLPSRVLANAAPNAPTLTGPANSQITVFNSYVVTATDPDGDNVQYSVDWGDGSTSVTDFTASGTSLTLAHHWTAVGIYQVSAAAKDTLGNVSAATVLTVNVYTPVPTTVQVTASSPIHVRTSTSVNSSQYDQYGVLIYYSNLMVPVVFSLVSGGGTVTQSPPWSATYSAPAKTTTAVVRGCLQGGSGACANATIVVTH